MFSSSASRKRQVTRTEQDVENGEENDERTNEQLQKLFECNSLILYPAGRQAGLSLADLDV